MDKYFAAGVAKYLSDEKPGARQVPPIFIRFVFVFVLERCRRAIFKEVGKVGREVNCRQMPDQRR
jgi:hypothetical protein